MSYLLDKKNKRKRFTYGAIFLAVFLIIFYFRVGIWNGLAYVSNKIFTPFLVVGKNIGGKLNTFHSYFLSKSSLYQNNLNLKSDLESYQAQNANYNTLLAENTTLKDLLGRKDTKTNTILATILSKPNQSPYDTLIIDVGSNDGIKVDSLVFSLGYDATGAPLSVIPIGNVSNVYDNSAKVVLFSNPGEQTQVLISHPTAGQVSSNVSIEVTGRGGGNFEMILPKDFVVQNGDEAVLPGINPYVLGTVQTILSDPRDSFTKALLVSPINIQELKFVEVEQ